ncbi:MAG TPA: NAD(P)/FAD-dependent oxidoreductase [Gaiellales bacterium]|nr:NAD(P)/FAD-dependent oxidoreductase [Gaiellales bacterium]
MEQYDVVIAGGGPAGLALAAPLATAGFAVLVCERNAEIGVPVRTSGGSWPDDLRRLGLPDHLWHPIHRLSFRSRTQACTIDWGGPTGCSLDVTAAWRYLAAEAERAGATVATGTLARLERTGRLSLRTGDDQRSVSCRLAVDATGTNALLARQSGVHEGFRRVGVGYERELSAPAFGQEEAMVIVGGVAPAGYAWAFPRGGTRVRVGVGLIQPDTDVNPRTMYEPVERLLADRLAGAEVLELHSGRIPSEEAPERLTGDGLMVVGDAGGQSNPLLGEGIRHVIQAAHRAAPIAIAALSRQGVVPVERLRAWERTGRRVRGTSWGLAMRANRYVARMDDDDWDRAVELLGRLPVEVATPMLRGDILDPRMLSAALRTGPSMAWRVLRPFALGGVARGGAPGISPQ